MSTEVSEQDIVRISRIASQLYGDLIQLLGVQPASNTEQQAMDLILASYETVGIMAMEVRDRFSGDYQPCRCGEYETCATCIEAHRQFQQSRWGDKEDGSSDLVTHDTRELPTHTDWTPPFLRGR